MKSVLFFDLSFEFGGCPVVLSIFWDSFVCFDRELDCFLYVMEVLGRCGGRV